MLSLAKYGKCCLLVGKMFGHRQLVQPLAIFEMTAIDIGGTVSIADIALALVVILELSIVAVDLSPQFFGGRCLCQQMQQLSLF